MSFLQMKWVLVCVCFIYLKPLLKKIHHPIVAPTFITVCHFYKAQNTPCICGNINDTPRISHNIICQTIETLSVSFLASLIEDGVTSPHLVVAPLSTLRNWEREFSTWTPHINVVSLGLYISERLISQFETVSILPCFIVGYVCWIISISSTYKGA